MGKISRVIKQDDLPAVNATLATLDYALDYATLDPRPVTSALCGMMPGGENILIVDDAPTICRFLKLLLEAEQYEVFSASSGSAAMECLAERRFGLIIVDKNLEDTDGLNVCRMARELDPNMARIIMTADPSVESAIAAVEEDIFAYLTKPLQKDQVLIKARRALDRVRLIREREEAREEMETAKEALEKRTRELEQTVSQLLRAQTRLMESEKLVSVGMLAAGVAHEINNPACFILPNLEYIKRGAHLLEKLSLEAGAPADKASSEAEHIDRMVDRCQQGVTRIQKVVGTLQLFSRRDPVETQPVELNTICRALLDIVAHELGDRARLDVTLQEPSPKVEARPKELALVVLNLLLNARRAVFAGSSEKKHCIKLQTMQQEDRVFLSVSDTGPPLDLGRSDQALDALFFSGVSEVEAKSSPRLTLSLVREIVDRYGGRLNLQSSPEGNTLEASFKSAAD